jgi:hypothetical protein
MLKTIVFVSVKAFKTFFSFTVLFIFFAILSILFWQCKAPAVKSLTAYFISTSSHEIMGFVICFLRNKNILVR